MPQWDPEIELDVPHARALIGGQFPELADEDVRPLAAGWDNTVMQVGDRWLFRFPRREVAVSGVEREIEALPRLAPNLPLPIPAPRWVGAPREGYPWVWFGSELIPGVELAEARLADDERVELGAAIGKFLRALHEPALRSRIGPTLPIDPNRRADMGFRVPMTRHRLDELARAGTWQTAPVVEALLADAAGLPPSSRTAVLHGDLHVRHVLVDAEGGAAGVIDWGDLCVGDPAIDLQLAYGAFVGPARTAMLEAYGRRIDGLTELRARVVAVSLAAALLDYAVDQRRQSLRAESLRSLERAVS